MTTNDSVGSAQGKVTSTALRGDGTVTLPGGASDQFVDLPPLIVSSLGDSVTIEAWVRWTGNGTYWERIFDFGSNTLGKSGQQAVVGLTYLFLSPMVTGDTMRAVMTTGGLEHEVVVNSSSPLPLPNDGSAFTYVAVVVDGTKSHTMTLYQDGVAKEYGSLNGTRLSLINDVNNWIGRSQYVVDPGFTGAITEFRIYGAARTADQIRAAFDAGPDVLPLQ
jgi:hypothetical protein